MDLLTCPSGECQEYAYTFAPHTVRVTKVVIHTREAYEECERLAALMSSDDYFPADQQYSEERWKAYHYGGGYLAR